MFKRWGIRDRMLLMALVPPTLIALILGFYVINLRIQELAQIHQDKGEALTRQMIPVARDALTSGNRSLLADQVAVMLGTPSVVDVVITDRRGEIVLRRSRPPQEDLADASRFSRWLRVSERDETLFTRAIPAAANEDDILGEVTIRLSRTLTRMRQMEVLFNGTLIIGVGLLISYFLALSTSRDIVVPILRLTRAVRSFRRGQLTRRVPEVSGGELGTLERGINAMADALLAIRQELQGQIYQSNAELRTTLEELEVKNVELDLARQRAEEASRVKSRFLANMSHEIRTPINGILGFARLLADKRLPQDAQEYADIIRQSAENLLGIIEDILDFSRIEAGKLSLQPLDFNLHRLVEEVTELLAPMAFDKRLELVPLIYRDVPEWVHGDVHRVRQVLTNLIGNAVKFTLHGQITVRAMLEDKTDTGTVIRLTVTDTGIGIDARQQQQIFQPFTQVDARATRQFGGTGLGLFISERLVRAMGGQIGLDSTPGKGSAFWFTVPLRPADHQPSSAPAPAPPGGRRVLVWDGFALGRRALRHCLEDWGLLVEEAETFQHLLQRAREQPTTVVIGLGAQGLALPEVKAQFHTLRDHRKDHSAEPSAEGKIQTGRRTGVPPKPGKSAQAEGPPLSVLDSGRRSPEARWQQRSCSRPPRRVSPARCRRQSDQPAAAGDTVAAPRGGSRRGERWSGGRRSLRPARLRRRPAGRAHAGDERAGRGTRHAPAGSARAAHHHPCRHGQRGSRGMGHVPCGGNG